MTVVEFPIPANDTELGLLKRAQEAIAEQHPMDYQAHAVAAAAFGPAPDGKHIGIMFRKTNGDVLQVALPADLIAGFAGGMLMAYQSCIERNPDGIPT